MNRKIVPILCIFLFVGGIVVTVFGIRNVIASRQVASTSVYDWSETGIDIAPGSDMNAGGGEDGVVLEQTEVDDGVEIGTESAVESASSLSLSPSESESE